MRLTLTAIGLAAGLTVLFTLTPKPESSDRLMRDYKTKIQELAFCQKGYEIASSFPSYASKSVSSYRTKMMLMKEAERLTARSDFIGNILHTEVKQEGLNLGIDENAYQALLADYTAKAEVAAINSIQSVDTSAVFLDRLDEVCAPYIK